MRILDLAFEKSVEEATLDIFMPIDELTGGRPVCPRLQSPPDGIPVELALENSCQGAELSVRSRTKNSPTRRRARNSSNSRLQKIRFRKPTARAEFCSGLEDETARKLYIRAEHFEEDENVLGFGELLC